MRLTVLSFLSSGTSTLNCEFKPGVTDLQYRSTAEEALMCSDIMSGGPR
jgi:hypothetical protein